MDPNDSDPYSEIHKLRILLLKKDGIASELRKELKDRTIALEVAEERIRRLVAASQKKSKPNTAPKLEPISPQRRMVPYVDVPPFFRQLDTQPYTSPSPPPYQNHESSTLDEMEVEDTPSMSPPPNMKLEPKSPHEHKRLIPYVSVPSRQMSTRPAKGALRPPPQVPTPASTSKRPKKEEHKIFSLPRSITDTYMKSYKPLTLTPPPIPLTVPRKLLRLAYGGSDQQFLQFVQPNANPSSSTLRRMVWPQIEMNPLMPSIPGHPGIVFASRHEILENPPWTVWCRCLESPTAMWSYLGEYESELCGEMSAEQFRDQPQKAKDAWAELLMKGKAFDVYVAMRARIALRKHNVIPLERLVLEDGKPETDEQVAVRSKSLEDGEIKAIKHKKGLEVESEDIIRAFSCGDEAIDIIRMRCVSYDHVFAQDLQRQFNNYDQLLEQEQGKKAAEEGGGGKQGSSLKRKRKVKGGTRRGEKGRGKGKGKARDTTPSEGDESEDEDDLEYVDQASSSSRPKRKSTKWDMKTGGRVVVGRGDVQANDGDGEVLCRTGWESDDDDSLPVLTDSDSGAETD